jgi:hypothetical protein
MRALSDFLWHERDVLERLLHRLETERALTETGRTRRLPLAAREVDAALDELHTAELARAAEAAAATQVLGLPATSTLHTIAGLAPVPWGEIFLEHRTAMRALVEAITALSDDRGTTAHHIAGPGMGQMADAELTDAVIDLELERIGRQAAESRGRAVPRQLDEFLG